MEMEGHWSAVSHGKPTTSGPFALSGPGPRIKASPSATEGDLVSLRKGMALVWDCRREIPGIASALDMAIRAMMSRELPMSGLRIGSSGNDIIQSIAIARVRCRGLASESGMG